jgi:hypothetical protein
VSSVAGIRVVAAGEGEPPAAQDAAPGSILAGLRERAARTRENKTLDVVVGGDFGDALVVRYGMPQRGVMDRYIALVQAGGKISELSATIDLAVASCRTLLARDGDRLVDLNVRLDAGLWRLLDWPLPEGIESHDELTADEVAYALFGGNEVRLANHVGEVGQWLQNPGGEPPGEASAAT